MCPRASVCQPGFNIEWAPGTRPDAAAAERLALVAERATPTVADVLDLGAAAITFTVVSELRDSDAMTLPDERRIVIPRAWIAKSETELSELVGHELAHVAIGRIPEFRRIPLWLREGVAELAAGRTGCGASRELGALHALGYDVRSALHDTSSLPTAIHYKVYGSFAAFTGKASRVSLGTALAEVAKHGADSGLKLVTGRDRVQLEEQWATGLRMHDTERSCD